MAVHGSAASPLSSSTPTAPRTVLPAPYSPFAAHTPVFLWSFVLAMVVMAHRLVLMPPQVSLSLSLSPSPSPSPSLALSLRATVISRRCLVPRRLDSRWTSSPSSMTERMSRDEARRQKKRRGLTLAGSRSPFNFRAAQDCTSAHSRSSIRRALSTPHAPTLLAHSPLHSLHFSLVTPLRIPPLRSPLRRPLHSDVLNLSTWECLAAPAPVPCVSVPRRVVLTICVPRTC